MSEFFTIISHHLPSLHCYADETQLYLEFKPVDTAAQDTAVSAMKACLWDIRQWMIKDKFMINDEKTELWWLELRHSGHESVIIPNDEAIRNLAVWLQSTFSMCSHVPRTCKSVFLLPSQYKAQYKYLNQESTDRLIHAFVISRLDYGITSNSIEKLRHVQIAATTVVYRAPTNCHITPTLFGLHWLPVGSRVIFHILTSTFKAVHNMAPKYLWNLITFKTSSVPPAT